MKQNKNDDNIDPQNQIKSFIRKNIREFFNSMSYVKMISNPEEEIQFLEEAARQQMVQGDNENEIFFAMQERLFGFKLIKDLISQGKNYWESCKIAQDDDYYYKQREQYFGPDCEYECIQIKFQQINDQEPDYNLHQNQNHENNLIDVNEQDLENDLTQFSEIITGLDDQIQQNRNVKDQYNDVYLKQYIQNNNIQVSKENIDFLQQFQTCKQYSQKQNIGKQFQNQKYNNQQQKLLKECKIFKKEQVRNYDIQQQSLNDQQNNEKRVNQPIFQELYNAIDNKMKFKLENLNEQQKQYVIKCVDELSKDNKGTKRKKRKCKRKK